MPKAGLLLELDKVALVEFFTITCVPRALRLAAKSPPLPTTSVHSRCRYPVSKPLNKRILKTAIFFRWLRLTRLHMGKQSQHLPPEPRRKTIPRMTRQEDAASNVPTGLSKVSAERLDQVPRLDIDWPELPRPLARGIYSFATDDFEYDFLFSTGEKDRLFVFLSGDAPRHKFQPPVFQRWSWAKTVPGHFLAISDPILKLSDDIGLGWYIGTQDRDPTETLMALIAKVAASVEVAPQDIYFYGSSGGGFAALRLAARTPGSTAIVINPQIVVTDYASRGVQRFLDRHFGGLSPSEAIRAYPDRFSVLPQCGELSERNNVLYVQNTLDDHHLKAHFKPFAAGAGLSESNGHRTKRAEVMFFEEPAGHNKAEPRQMVPAIINRALGLTESHSAGDPNKQQGSHDLT